ncbi:hypothetical protein [Synechococcus sp. CS-205]|uniref:hypothetical protein n=1 Tax=Synechococcus sp. CS-205 TaxID=2847984 RepID=UPI00223AFF24|nr:hypothetical protein [Synechococcus sp. CS-205]MCT0248913.1 hypothetical protein [Synechococcus sp. CS-205]
MVLFNPKGLMARHRNHYHYIRGRKVTASKDSYWAPADIVAFVQTLKAQDPAMVVNLYPTDFRDALRAALEAAGMRWHFIDADENERFLAQSRAESRAFMKRIEAENRAEWRRSCSVT